MVFDIIDEIVAVFEADAFHAGMDEVFFLGEDERCKGRDKAELFGDIGVIINPWPGANLIPQITSIYPNPVKSDFLNILFSHPVDGDVSYTIFDLTGKVVQFEELNGNNTVLFKIRLTENMASGMYYLKMNSKAHQAVWYQRFIRAG